MSDSAPPSPTTPDAPAGADSIRRLDEIVVGDRLARWTHGSLHTGRDAAKGTEVSIWVFTPPVDRPELGEEFLRTGRLLATLKHPVLAAVRMTGREGERFLVVTEPVGGVPLTGSAAPTRPTDRTVARWGRDLALALQALHQSGLVARDIKPANLRVEAAGSLRWVGAGLTRHFGAPSVEYLSPEQARGEEEHIGPQSDIYSLGAVLHERLVGVPPFVGSTDLVRSQTGNLFQEVSPVRASDPTICPALEAIVGKALRKDRTQRYADGATMAVDLQRLLQGEPLKIPIRFEGAPPFDCPACRRPTAAQKPQCIYCNADTTGLPAEPGARPRTRADWPNDEARHVPLPAVRLGLTCHAVRLVMYMLAVVVAIGGIGASLMLDPRGVAGPKPLLTLTLLAVAALFALPPFLGLIGSALGFTAPRESGARSFALLALALDAAALALGAAPFALEASLGTDDPLVGPAAALMFGVLRLLAGLLGWAFVLAYCGRLAGYLGRPASQFDAHLAIKQGFLLVFGTLFAPVLIAALCAAVGAAVGFALGDAPSGARLGGGVGGALGLALAVYCLFFLVRLLFDVIALFGVLREATALPNPTEGSDLLRPVRRGRRRP